jgi:hypothetical protein
MASGPPSIPAGITNALNTFLDHEINGPPSTAIPANPIIPGNPIFGEAPGMQIFQAHFGGGFSDTTTIDVLGVADLHHDALLG